MSDRRLAILEISMQKMLELMCRKSHINTDEIEGFEVLECRYLWKREVFHFKITHESLKRVAEGSEIPQIEVPIIEEQWCEWPEETSS